MKSCNIDNIRIESYETLDELQKLLPLWEDLLQCYAPATTFSTWEWLSSWWRAFGDEQHLLVLAFFDDTAGLIGLAPLSITSRRIASGVSLKVLRLMGDGSKDSDNLDLPVRPEFAEPVVRALRAYLEKKSPAWDVCELNTLPPESPSAQHLVEHIRQQGWMTFEKRRIASAIKLPATWEEYLNRLSSEDRKNLGRYSRRLEKRYKVNTFKCVEEHQIAPCLEALFQNHQSRWEAEGQSGSFGSTARRLFYNELSHKLLARGWLEMWGLELDGQLASVQYAFRYRDTVFQLQEGNDPVRSSDRVGFVLRGQVLQQLIKDGVRTYDFLGGDPGYKLRWGAEPFYYRDLHFARPSSKGALYLWSINNAGTIKQTLKQRLPASAWNALHKANLVLRGKKNKSADPATTDVERSAQSEDN